MRRRVLQFRQAFRRSRTVNRRRSSVTRKRLPVAKAAAELIDDQQFDQLFATKLPANDFWGVLIRYTSAPSMLKNFNLPTVGYRIGPTITIPWRDLWSVELAPDPNRSFS